jgi:hypothetical protein
MASRRSFARRPSQRAVVVGVALAIAIGIVGWRLAAPPAVPPAPTVIPPLPPGDPAVLVAAGDIAECGDRDDEATADLVDRIPGTVLALGDNAYPSGSLRDFRECYGASWGRFAERTQPVAGNHEYETDDAAGLRAYWPGGLPETWYAFDVGEWRVVVLDSNCEAVGGCGPESPQGRWLADELAANPSRCTLAAWHHPRFSSGWHGNIDAAAPLWEAAHDGGVDVVLTAHDHDYERFAPLRRDGAADGVDGMRQFVVGTGGGRLRGFDEVRPHSEVRESDTFGVLRLALLADRYQWDFVPVAGGTFTDHGTGTCR